VFNRCELDFQLEFRTTGSSDKICDKGTTITALNILKDAANEEISSKNITGIRAIVDGNNLVLLVDKNKEI
jgi:hypothetical protein